MDQNQVYVDRNEKTTCEHWQSLHEGIQWVKSEC